MKRVLGVHWELDREERIWPKASQATRWLRRMKMTSGSWEEAVGDSGE